MPILPLAAQDLGASIALAGIIAALRGLGNYIFDIPAGIIVGRIGERWSILSSGAILVVACVFAIYAITAIESSTTTALICFSAVIFLMGAASSLWQVARLVYIAGACSEELRGRGISLVGGFTRAGRFAGPVLAAFLYTFSGLEMAFVLFSIFTLVALVLILSSFQDTLHRVPEDTISLREIGVVIISYKSIFSTVGVAVILLAVVRYSRDVFWPLWGSQIGLSAQEISLIMGLSFAVDTVPFYFAGIIMDKFGRRAAAIPSLLILSVTTLGLIFTESFSEMLIVCLISGFGNGLGSGIVMTIGADLSLPENRGQFIGVWRLVSDTGQAGGSMLVGPLAAITSLAFTVSGIGAIGLLGVLMFVFFVQEPKTIELPSRSTDDSS